MCAIIGLERQFHWILIFLLSRVNLSSAVTEIIMESEFGEVLEHNFPYNASYTFVCGSIGGVIGGTVGNCIEFLQIWNPKDKYPGISAVFGGLGGSIGGGLGAYLDGGNVTSIVGAVVGGQLGGSVGGYLGLPVTEGVFYLMYWVLFVLPRVTVSLWEGEFQAAWRILSFSTDVWGAMDILSMLFHIFIPAIVGVVGGIGGGYGAIWGAEVLNRLAIGSE